MNPEEYIQLKAFARIDGALLGLLWIVSFACYIYGFSNAIYSLLAVVTALSSPVFVAVKAYRFKTNVRSGEISFMRSFAYSALIFFYGALIFALAQFIYFAYIDGGTLFSNFHSIISGPEARQLIGSQASLSYIQNNLSTLMSMSPIELALNFLSTNITIGIILSIPIAFITRIIGYTAPNKQ